MRVEEVKVLVHRVEDLHNGMFLEEMSDRQEDILLQAFALANAGFYERVAQEPYVSMLHYANQRYEQVKGR